MSITPISVSQLNNYIARIIGTDPLLGNINVKGEISNMNFHSSGNVFFTIKDDNSTMKCILPWQNAESIKSSVKDGMEAVISGYVSVYKKGGYYSLTVKDIEIEGQGILSIAFEKMKDKLEKEGLFDYKHKKSLPFFPKKIGIITSNTGAAIADMLNIIKNRNNIVDILIYPTLVQGSHAANSIAEGVKDINDRFKDEIDVIIVGRGGGSVEDLWAFNEEALARAIFESKIPIISAVGHEVDFTISDFVADKRAETPTAAAIMAVPNIEDIRQYLLELKNKLFNSLIVCVERNKSRLTLLKSQLESVNPKRIIKSGYGAIIDENRKFITSMSEIKEGDSLTIIMGDGEIDISVLKMRE